MVELKRMIIFMDHANIFHVLQAWGLRIDYKRLREIISKNYNLIAAIAYLGLPQKLLLKKIKFLKTLERSGWKIVFKPLVTNLNGVSVQNNVIQEMLTQITELVDSYDKVVIISGNGLFAQLIESLLTLKKEVEVWSFRESLSYEIIRSVGPEHVKYLDYLIFNESCIIKL